MHAQNRHAFPFARPRRVSPITHPLQPRCTRKPRETPPNQHLAPATTIAHGHAHSPLRTTLRALIRLSHRHAHARRPASGIARSLCCAPLGDGAHSIASTNRASGSAIVHTSVSAACGAKGRAPRRPANIHSINPSTPRLVTARPTALAGLTAALAWSTVATSHAHTHTVTCTATSTRAAVACQQSTHARTGVAASAAAYGRVARPPCTPRPPAARGAPGQRARPAAPGARRRRLRTTGLLGRRPQKTSASQLL